MASFQIFPAGHPKNKLTGNSPMSWTRANMKSSSMHNSCFNTLSSKACKIILTFHTPYFRGRYFSFPDLGRFGYGHKFHKHFATTSKILICSFHHILFLGGCSFWVDLLREAVTQRRHFVLLSAGLSLQPLSSEQAGEHRQFTSFWIVKEDVNWGKALTDN